MTVTSLSGATTFRHTDGLNTTIDPATWDLVMVSDWSLGDRDLAMEKP
jgi:hypothetical protein